jgi:prepilin-type N-terminal cleavage/methylation domain-containing protein
MGTKMELQEQDIQHRNERGFTLIELLIAIVVVGVLTAVAIVGIGGLVDNGHTAACQASGDAAKAASAVFYANSAAGTYPADFHDLVTPNKVYDIPSGVSPIAPAVGDLVLTGKGWTLTMAGGGATAPTFTCA